jgi:ureidoglycolate hydrolase
LAGQDRKAVIVAVCEQENKKDMGFTLEAMRTQPFQGITKEKITK